MSSKTRLRETSSLVAPAALGVRVIIILLVLVWLHDADTDSFRKQG